MRRKVSKLTLYGGIVVEDVEQVRLQIGTATGMRASPYAFVFTLPISDVSVIFVQQHNTSTTICGYNLRTGHRIR